MTIEDKILGIARFCEIDVHKLYFKKDPSFVRIILGKEEDFDWDSIIDFNPDRDWNWLMKAWKKFREYNLYDYEYMRHESIIATKITFGTISEAFEALYEGVNWYTNQSNPSHH